MKYPPRIWLNYRPVRIGWVIADRSISRLATAAMWNTCLWGGRHNCIIPAHDAFLAEQLVACFGVDLLIPVDANAEAEAFIGRFPHLKHYRSQKNIFQRQSCEFADVHHVLARIKKQQDRDFTQRMVIPEWHSEDELSNLFAVQLGRYPQSNIDVPDYAGTLINSFETRTLPIQQNDELPASTLRQFAPLGLSSYGLGRVRNHRDWLRPGILLGSINDFDALVSYWNLRAAGASLVFYDQDFSPRLKNFAEAFLTALRAPHPSKRNDVSVWLTRDRAPDDSWRPDLQFGDSGVNLKDTRDVSLWNGLNIEPERPSFFSWHRDVIPSYAEVEGKANVSFALPDRPFNDDDVTALSQKFVVTVDASQFGGPDSELTFETPFAPRLNEFYSRNIHDAARSELGRLNRGSIGIITRISSQRLQINAFRTLDWLGAFFELCQIGISRSEPGLRCSRLIAQLGGLQDCRVLKIRGVRELLRKYSVDESFTRSAAIEAIRDVDQASGQVGFENFKQLHIEYREKAELRPDDVLRFLLERRVFRVGLELSCPNCQLPSWIHIDDVKTASTCGYCDYHYDITSQLKDRDWRYRRSGIFGRNDNQLGGVPVALTLQQLATSLDDDMMMYSTALNFTSKGASIEKCESDFVAVVSGGMSQSPNQIVFGEAKTGKQFDADDVHKLSRLADAIPSELAEAFILFSKAGTFSSEEINLAKAVNRKHQSRVILWSREELEPYFPYERSEAKLGGNWHATTLSDMAKFTERLFFT